MEQECGGIDPAEKQDTAELTAASVFELAVQMVSVGADAPIVFMLAALAAEPTVEVCALVRQAVRDLFESKRFRDLICRSPERSDFPGGGSRLCSRRCCGH